VENLRAAVVAYQNALQINTKETLTQAWAASQLGLGNAYRCLGERLNGTEGVEGLRAAVIAYQNALQVRTKESLPQDWAATQLGLAKAYVSQKKWEEAAQALENVLTLHPTFIEALKSAQWIYQERLFRFDRAFELNAKQVELGDGELPFIEKHLTTAHFEGCAARATALRAQFSEKNERLVLTALRFACLAADQKTEDARAAGRQLVKDISGLEKVGWTFTGVEHFVSQQPAFAVNHQPNEESSPRCSSCDSAAAWRRMFQRVTRRSRVMGVAGALRLYRIPDDLFETLTFRGKTHVRTQWR
jgi:tetratricopeptide (TPR) repeat protein